MCLPACSLALPWQCLQCRACPGRPQVNALDLNKPPKIGLSVDV